MNAIAKLKEKIDVIDKLLSVTANSTRRHAELKEMHSDYTMTHDFLCGSREFLDYRPYYSLKELSRSKNQNELNEIYNELKRLSIRNITESE
jgi:hypothetical protein